MGRQIPGLGDLALFQKEPTTDCGKLSQMWSKRVSEVAWFQHDCLRQESWTSSMRCTCSLQPWYRSHDVETFDISGWCQLWAGIFGIAPNACEEPGSECWVDYSDSHFHHHDLLRSLHLSIRTPLNMMILSHSLSIQIPRCHSGMLEDTVVLYKVVGDVCSEASVDRCRKGFRAQGGLTLLTIATC